MKRNFMRHCIEIARKGAGRTSPNPMVGCVVVKDGRIIGEDYHHRYGEFHAERNALLNCKEDTAGAELYVNLEPCCHYGKTPPCTEIIIEKKIRKVYVGALDPNPKVAGKGIEILREAGIEVEVGICEKECLELNKIFYHYMTTGMPYVVMKYAMTLDGKIACHTGDSRWVTGEASRRFVHDLRRNLKGIMVGVQTVIEDDPLLNCRCNGAEMSSELNPVRIICDSNLRIPLDSKIVTTAKEISTIVACVKGQGDSEKSEKLRNAGVEVIEVTEEIKASGKKQVDMKELMKILAEKKIDSILLEGGGTLNASALEEKIVTEVYAFISPKLIGGVDAPSPVKGKGMDRMIDAIDVVDTELIKTGRDFIVRGRVEYREEEPCLQE